MTTTKYLFKESVLLGLSSLFMGKTGTFLQSVCLRLYTTVSTLIRVGETGRIDPAPLRWFLAKELFDSLASKFVTFLEYEFYRLILISVILSIHIFLKCSHIYTVRVISCDFFQIMMKQMLYFFFFFFFFFFFLYFFLFFFFFFFFFPPPFFSTPPTPPPPPPSPPSRDF